MPPRSPEPLRRVTIYMFETDCAYMERRHGWGWTEKVRDLLRSHVRQAAKPSLDELLEQLEEEEHG